jgi:hypothetical protein
MRLVRLAGVAGLAGLAAAVFILSTAFAQQNRRAPRAARAFAATQRMRPERRGVSLVYLARHYRLFAGYAHSQRRAVAQAAALPAALPAPLRNYWASSQPGSPLASIEPEPALAVDAGTLASGNEVWAYPTLTGGPCLTQTTPSGTPDAMGTSWTTVCGKTAEDVEYTSVVESTASGKYQISYFGIVPNDVRDVRVAFGNRTTQTALVNPSNLWSVTDTVDTLGPATTPTALALGLQSNATRTVDLPATASAAG